MDAQILNLDQARLERRSRMLFKKFSRAHSIPPGLALMKGATLFWAEYTKAMVSFHVTMLSSVWSAWLSKQSHQANE